MRGHHVKMAQRFRDFANIAEAFDEHGRLLATGRRYAEARRVAHDPVLYATALTGTYATALNYGATLIAIINDNDLTRFDDRHAPSQPNATGE